METPHDDNLWLWQGKPRELQKKSIADIFAEKKHNWVAIAGLVFFLVLTPLLLAASLLAWHGSTPTADAQTTPAVAKPEPAKQETIKEMPKQEPTKPINETKPEVSPKVMEDAKALNDMLEWWKQQKANQAQANTRAAHADAPSSKAKHKAKTKEWQHRQVDPEINHFGCPPSLGGACTPTKELAKLDEN